MLVLRFAPEGRDATVVVPVFGVGLIGASIVERLSGSEALQKSLPLSWDEPDTQACQMKEIEGYIDRFLERSRTTLRCLVRLHSFISSGVPVGLDSPPKRRQ